MQPANQSEEDVPQTYVREDGCECVVFKMPEWALAQFHDRYLAAQNHVDVAL